MRWWCYAIQIVVTTAVGEQDSNGNDQWFARGRWTWQQQRRSWTEGAQPWKMKIELLLARKKVGWCWWPLTEENHWRMRMVMINESNKRADGVGDVCCWSSHHQWKKMMVVRTVNVGGQPRNRESCWRGQGWLNVFDPRKKQRNS